MLERRWTDCITLQGNYVDEEKQFLEKMFYSPFASGLIERCVTSCCRFLNSDGKNIFMTFPLELGCRLMNNFSARLHCFFLRSLFLGYHEK